MKIYLLPAILTSLILATTQNTWANEAAITSLVKIAQSNFTNVSDVQSLKEGNQIIADANACDLALQLSGGKQLICSWQFDYRDREATEQFKKLNGKLRTYSGNTSNVIEDLDVNHPDFYDLKTYIKTGIKLAVSLKDKAALDQTYVFFRVAKSD